MIIVAGIAPALAGGRGSTSSMQIRPAKPSEMDDIYMMGYDVWSEGKTQANYLNHCRNSPKYQRGRWYVLADDRGQPVSSLITYQLSSDAIGIGSIATLPGLRRQGLARRLVEGVLSLVKRKGAGVVFLFSDIHPGYYEKIGFKPLPEQFQGKKGSVCMAWGASVEELTRQPDFAPPSYF
jgi:predicted N-acetyltransferase YhbS